MIFKIWKIEIVSYTSKQPENFPCPLIGVGYFAHGHGSTLLASLRKRLYYGPQLTLYFFYGSRVLELSVEWKISRPPTVYASREEMRASLERS